MRSDEYYMARALVLARKGQGSVSPNPMVGAVVVAPDGKILAEGFHQRYGGLHAEREVLSKLNYRAHGCTLYVNLEPCCHYGKTPPCTEAIIESGVKRVVVGTLDPNPLVSGKGINILKAEGIEVKVGVLEGLCRWLNRGFFYWVKTGLPYVILKWAQSLDGRIATFSGDSRWISSKVSLRYAHRLRAQADAVLVGADTVLKDNPRLTVRLWRGKDPVRVILDTRMRLPVDRDVFSVPPATFLFTSLPDARKKGLLESRGVRVIEVPQRDGRVSLKAVLKYLGGMGITTLLVEGGAQVHASFLKEGLFQEVQVVLAPKIIGEGRGAVASIGVDRVSDAVKLEWVVRRSLWRDMLFVLQPVEA